jgi:hypothetical protein
VAQWVVEKYGDKYAFKNVASGTYLTRCYGCWKSVSKSSYDDSATVHVKSPSSPIDGRFALWTITPLSNFKYTLKGQNDQFLNVCNLCVNGGIWRDYAFIEVSNPEDPSINGIAQWEITSI